MENSQLHQIQNYFDIENVTKDHVIEYIEMLQDYGQTNTAQDFINSFETTYNEKY